ncbi:MAG: glycogen synthase GlgA [Myxococcaceae bacterium]
MRILFLASEVVPFSKTGGLADVAGALPAALAKLGHEVVVATPLYGSIRSVRIEPLGKKFTLRFPFGDATAELHEARLSPNHRVLFIGNGPLFGRPGIYGERSGEYPDNHRRFAFFSMAALTAAQHIGFAPDVVHLNDWQTGLGALALRRGYRGTSLEGTRSVFTIHNMAYQGVFPKQAMRDLGLPWELFTVGGLEFYDQVNFLKAGLVYSDALTTVSRRYAEEIQTPEAGWGLDGLLRARSARLFGILNGVDTQEWNLRSDPLLPGTDKATCKRVLAERFGLELPPEPPGPPVFGIVSRLASQKGLELVFPLLERLLKEDVRLVMLGNGDPQLENRFRAAAERYPGKVGVYIGYDNPLSHLIEAGSDFFLMPSLYEPCGLNQMYSLLYGAVPIVRAVGGLDDTVIDASQPEGNGFKFGPFTVEALEEAIGRALALYRDPQRLADVRQRGMHSDFSWDRSARRYLEVYEAANPL